jgi:RNA polymerase sigma factor (TIGR02999 family)
MNASDSVDDSESGSEAALSGKAHAQAHELLPAVYDDLRRLAAQRIASIGPGQTLQATSVVHEAWLRLENKQREWAGATHFFATAAEVMRHIVIDHLRGKSRQKRGGGQFRLNIEDLELAGAPQDERLLVIDEALQQLERAHPDKARIVVLKFFGGLTDREAAETLGVTERTIERHWAYAKAWLLRHIREESELSTGK